MYKIVVLIKNVAGDGKQPQQQRLGSANAYSKLVMWAELSKQRVCDRELRNGREK